MRQPSRFNAFLCSLINGRVVMHSIDIQFEALIHNLPNILNLLSKLLLPYWKIVNQQQMRTLNMFNHFLGA